MGGWWVVEADFSVKLEPQAEQFLLIVKRYTIYLFLYEGIIQM